MTQGRDDGLGSSVVAVPSRPSEFRIVSREFSQLGLPDCLVITNAQHTKAESVESHGIGIPDSVCTPCHQMTEHTYDGRAFSDRPLVVPVVLQGRRTSTASTEVFSPRGLDSVGVPFASIAIL